MDDSIFDIAKVRFVKRIKIGTSDPRDLKSEEFLEAQTALLNRCLSEVPKGNIIGQEKNVNVIRMGEQQIVIQSIVYHVGFVRKPHWLS